MEIGVRRKLSTYVYQALTYAAYSFFKGLDARRIEIFVDFCPDPDAFVRWVIYRRRGDDGVKKYFLAA